MTDSELSRDIAEIVKWVGDGDEYPDGALLEALTLALELVDAHADGAMVDQKARIVFARLQSMLLWFNGIDDLLPATRTTMELLWPLLVDVRLGHQQGNA